MTAKKKMGRPKIPKSEARSLVFNIRLKEEEAKQIQLFARKENITLSEWVRKSLLKVMENAMK